MSQELLTSILNIGSEIIYGLCGLVCICTAMRGLKNEKAKVGTFLFWFILGFIFILGKVIPKELTGMLLVFLGCITVTKNVQPGVFEPIPQEFKQEQSEKLGNQIFLPALTLAACAMIIAMSKFGFQNGALMSFPLSLVILTVAILLIIGSVYFKKAGHNPNILLIPSFVFVITAVLFAKFQPGGETNVAMPGALAVGLASILAVVVGWFVAKPKFSDVVEDSTRLLMQVGSASLLPQLLGALGAIFTSAGVGTLISTLISGVIPEGNIVAGVVIYVFGMVIFTMIMGNAFAAFSVITIGIGIPFVIAQGGDPVIIGALGMTAGFCGTLMTPMAANFNVVPVSILEMKNKYTVIKKQAPFALILIVVHIVLMLLLAF